MKSKADRFLEFACGLALGAFITFMGTCLICNKTIKNLQADVVDATKRMDTALKANINLQHKINELEIQVAELSK